MSGMQTADEENNIKVKDCWSLYRNVIAYKTQMAYLILYLQLISLIYAATGNVMHQSTQLIIYFFSMACTEFGLYKYNIRFGKNGCCEFASE